VTYITSTPFPDLRNHTHRVAALAQALRSLLTRGVTGENLAQQLRGSAPAELFCDADGWRVKCYGLETPPCPSKTNAVYTWAEMADAVLVDQVAA